jgi:hypothetical protein
VGTKDPVEATALITLSFEEDPANLKEILRGYVVSIDPKSVGSGRRYEIK